MADEWRPYPPAPDSYLASESGADKAQKEDVQDSRQTFRVRVSVKEVGA